MQTSPQLASGLPATSIENSEIIGSGSRNDEKLAKSNFTKPIHEVEEPSFLTSNDRWAFTQLRQAFTKALIL